MKQATWEIENRLGREAGFRIGGCDECGRGALASIFVASCACFVPGIDVPYPIRDSKQYANAAEREQIVARLTTEFLNQGLLSVSYAEASVGEIETSNLDKLNLALFKKAMAALDPPCDKVILDGKICDRTINGLCMPKADEASITVAVASLFAKVYRDRRMQEIHRQYPLYGFDQHVGYGTQTHIQAILKYGPVKGVHRSNFIATIMKNQRRTVQLDLPKNEPISLQTSASSGGRH